MTLPDQLIIPIGEPQPGIVITAEHVASMAACGERMAISQAGTAGPALGWFSVDARADGLWATKIELTPDGRDLADNADAAWLAAYFDLGGLDAAGAARGARCYAAVVKIGAPSWRHA